MKIAWLALALSLTGLLAPDALAEQAPAQPAPAVPRPRVDFPDPTGDLRLERVWGDGADVLLVAGERRILRIERSGAIQEGPGPYKPLAFAMTGRPPAARFAIAGEHGFSIYSGGTWEYALAPSLDAEALTGVAFDATGRLFLAGKHRALYVREPDASWKTYRYPGGGVDVIHAAFGPGALYLIGAHARAFAFSAGQFRELMVTGLTSGVQGSPWTHAWMNPAGTKAWITCEKSVLGLELPSANLTVSASPLFFEPSSFAGASVGGGDLIALGSMSELGVFDGTGFTKVPGEIKHSSSLYFDVKQSMIYEVQWGKLNRYPVRHPRLGSGRGEAWAP